ncbi:hypothetical protein KA977_02365 [Candidatus Dependentiae bacterium]|nr:hypothetical protein [Candidatus Dependentiae bacterium]
MSEKQKKNLLQIEECLKTMPDFKSEERLERLKIEELIKLPSLFYLGAGRDIDPLLLFAENTDIPLYIYCALETIDCNEIINHINKKYSGCRLLDTKPIYKSDIFNISKNIKFKYSESIENADILGFISFLRIFGKDICLLYLFFDGRNAYNIIWSQNNAKPEITVLQKHGLVGPNPEIISELYKIAKNNLPNYLYVSEGTDCWKGYNQISDFNRKEGMHDIPRALYKKN